MNSQCSKQSSLTATLSMSAFNWLRSWRAVFQSWSRISPAAFPQRAGRCFRWFVGAYIKTVSASALREWIREQFSLPQNETNPRIPWLPCSCHIRNWIWPSHKSYPTSPVGNHALGPVARTAGHCHWLSTKGLRSPTTSKAGKNLQKNQLAKLLRSMDWLNWF